MESVQESLTTVCQQVSRPRTHKRVDRHRVRRNRSVRMDARHPCQRERAGRRRHPVLVPHGGERGRNAAGALAVQWALIHLGAPYACEGVGRLNDWALDCSSYVSRAYVEGVGLDTAGADWAPITAIRAGAASLTRITRSSIRRICPRPGPVHTCTAEEKDGECDYRHVVMYLGEQAPGMGPLMAHTNAAAKSRVAPFTGTDVQLPRRPSRNRLEEGTQSRGPVGEDRR